MRYILLLLFGWATVFAQQEGLSVSVSGDTATIWNSNLVQNCAFRVVFDVAVRDTALTVTEIDTSKLSANCVCTFHLSVSISGLATGTYTANVYRRYTAPFMHPESTYYVGSVQFTISSGMGFTNVRGSQSACSPSYSVETTHNLPTQYALQNFPNPFNPSTTIAFDVPEKAKIRLAIFDCLGREVALLAEGYRLAGHYTVPFYAGNLPSGVYFYRLRAGTFVETKKMLLMR